MRLVELRGLRTIGAFTSVARPDTMGMIEIQEQGHRFRWHDNGGSVHNDEGEIIGHIEEDADDDKAIGQLRAIAISYLRRKSS